MKNIQKLGSLLLAVLMILSLAACGSKTNNTPAQTPSNDTPAESAPAETPDDTAAEPDNSASGGKVLVVYYSASGNTKRVAEEIADAAGGDLFEMTPAEPYTSDDLIPPGRPSDYHGGGKLGRLRHRVHRLSHLVGDRGLAC